MRAALFLVLVGCSSSGSTAPPPTQLRIVRVDADGGSTDAATEEAPTAKLEGGLPPIGSLCDRDGDGFRAMGSPCHGNDCDDDDPRAHPGASFLYDPPTEATLGDWNCNNA